MLKVLKAGACSTIQDAGRMGYQAYGVIVGGVMDQVAFRLGNALLGQTNKACIEMVLVGGVFEFMQATSIVLTGRKMQARLNGRDVPMYQVLHVKASDRLACRNIVGRGYLCVAGGFTVEAVLGSRATYMAAQIGGLSGRMLQKGDIVPYNGTLVAKKHLCAASFYKEGPIRVLAGTEWSKLSRQQQTQLLQQRYTISTQSNRVGYRLMPTNPIIVDAPPLISEAVTFGTMQLPPSGEPIILMADCQTTGGYLKVAQVIAADLPRLAQMMPGEEIELAQVTLQQAERAKVKLERALRLIRTII